MTRFLVLFKKIQIKNKKASLITNSTKSSCNLWGRFFVFSLIWFSRTCSGLIRSCRFTVDCKSHVGSQRTVKLMWVCPIRQCEKISIRTFTFLTNLCFLFPSRQTLVFLNNCHLQIHLWIGNNLHTVFFVFE